MAGDWIKVRVRLVDDPAVLAISTRFGILPETVVGYLIRAWSWATDQLVDGHAPGVTLAHFDRVVGLQNFGESLVEVRWLKATKSGLIFPKWDRHLSQGSKARALATNRKSQERHGASVTKTRPEKRREEKSTKDPHSPPQAGDGKKPKKLIPDYTPAFEQFWRRYPTIRRQNKTGAFQVWQRDEIERPAEPGKRSLLDFVMESLEKWIKCESWQEGYVCGPRVWLNQKRWSNDPPRRENVE